MTDSSFIKFTKSVFLYIGLIISIILGNVIFEQSKSTLNELHRATMEIEALKTKVAILEKPAIVKPMEVPPMQEMPIPDAVHIPHVAALEVKPAFEANKMRPHNEPSEKKESTSENIPENGKFTLLTDDKKTTTKSSAAPETNFKLLSTK